MFVGLIQSLASRIKPQRRKSSNEFRPLLEALEERQLLSTGAHDILLPPTGSAWWGTAVDYRGDKATEINDLETKMGRQEAIIHDYWKWNNAGIDPLDASLSAGGRVLWYTWKPMLTNGTIIQWSAVANGSQDAQIDALAANLKAFGKPIFLTFHHEPENDVGTFGTTADYVAAWDHVVDRFKADGATNVIWVWDMMGYSGWNGIINQLYPGDNYVDWIAMDPYNRGTNSTSTQWKSFEQITEYGYDWATTNHPNIPLMLGEYGTPAATNDPNARAQWFTDELTDLKTTRTAFKAVVYWDGDDQQNYHIENDPPSMQAFAAISHDPRVNAMPGANQAPTVATAAHVVSSTATSTALNVQGADDHGEANLTYTWSVTAKPATAANPTYTFGSGVANGSNGAKNVTVNFAAIGAYTLRATISDQQGKQVTSDVTVNVTATLTSIVVTPGFATVYGGNAQAFTAAGKDQFGAVLASQPAITWTANGGGSITSNGTYTAPSAAVGTAIIRAANGNIGGTATVAYRPLPSPWSSGDIGASTILGSTTYAAATGSFTVTGGGTDIWKSADQFQYVYQQLTGDGTIIARVDSIGNTNAWAKAGLMMRNSLDANSPFADMLITPTSGAAFQYRAATNASAVHIGKAGYAAPSWVKLVRSGNSFSGYVSNDGVTWTLVGTETIAMNSTIYVGLAVTSHNAGKATTASFSGVQLS